VKENKFSLGEFYVTLVTLFSCFNFYFIPLLFFMFFFRASNTHIARKKQHKQQYEINTYNLAKVFVGSHF